MSISSAAVAHSRRRTDSTKASADFTLSVNSASGRPGGGSVDIPRTSGERVLSAAITASISVTSAAEAKSMPMVSRNSNPSTCVLSLLGTSKNNEGMGAPATAKFAAISASRAVASFTNTSTSGDGSNASSRSVTTHDRPR